jgi:hypothetical protein
VRIVFFYTVPVQKPKQGAPEHGVDKGSSLESAEGAAYWKGGSWNITFCEMYVLTNHIFKLSFIAPWSADEIVKDSSKSKVIDDDGYVIVPKLSSQESKEVN